MPKISVVLPVYNGEKFLREAIESILNQTSTDFELLIVDDGSTDATADIVRSYTDERIQYHQRPHQGLVDTLNFGLHEAKGEYIARLDADDVALPERLEKQYQYFNEHPDVVLVGSHAIAIDEQGKEIGVMKHSPVGRRDIRRYSLLHNPFIHPSVMFRKALIGIVGGYRYFEHCEDYELWTRIIYKNDIDTIPEPLIKYRVHNAQMTQMFNAKMRLHAMRVRFLAGVRFLSSFLK